MDRPVGKVERTVDIRKQKNGEATCTHHSVARVAYRLLRIVGYINYKYYDKILMWLLAKFPPVCEGTNTVKLLNALVVDGDDILPDDDLSIRNNLRIVELIHQKRAGRKRIQNILSQKRHVICAIYINVASFSGHDGTTGPLGPDVFPEEVPDEDVWLDGECWHQVVLYKWEYGLLYFKNSHGKMFGASGTFCMLETLLSQRHSNFHFHDLRINNWEEGHKQKAGEFKPHEIPFLCSVPSVDVHDIVIIKSDSGPGSGGQATVYDGLIRNFQGKAPMNVAVRKSTFPNSEVTAMEDFISKMYQFEHENVIDMYAYCVYKNDLDFTVKIAMSREECSLSFMLEKNGDIGWGRFYFAILDVARGIEYLHSAGVFHADLCSNNVVVSKTGVCKLIDFQSISLKGTQGAPKACKVGWVERNHPTDYYTDIYSLGKLIMYLRCGSQNLSLGDSKARSMPPSLYNLMAECLKAKPRERPSAAEFISRFTHIFATPGVLPGVVYVNHDVDGGVELVGHLDSTVDKEICEYIRGVRRYSNWADDNALTEMGKFRRLRSSGDGEWKFIPNTHELVPHCSESYQQTDCDIEENDAKMDKSYIDKKLLSLTIVMALLAVVVLAAVSSIAYRPVVETVTVVSTEIDRSTPPINLQNAKDIERVDKAITSVKNVRNDAQKLVGKVEDVAAREANRIMHQFGNEGKKLGKKVKRALNRFF